MTTGETDNMLLIDCCNNSSFQLELIESATTKGRLVKFRGKFQEAEAINKNKRIINEINFCYCNTIKNTNLI